MLVLSPGAPSAEESCGDPPEAELGSVTPKLEGWQRSGQTWQGFGMVAQLWGAWKFPAPNTPGDPGMLQGNFSCAPERPAGQSFS